MDWQSLLSRNSAALGTPALIIDLDAFERNVAKMAAHCRDAGIALRAHAKSHKSGEIARRQVAAGAIGLCAATLDEAEMLAEAGIASILVTSPLASQAAIARLMKLNATCPGLMAVADDKDVVVQLAQAAAAARQVLKLLVDVDIGHHRTGIAAGAPALGLAELIAKQPSLRFEGLQGYAGHLMHLHDRAERKSRSAEALRWLAETRDMLAAKGLESRIITGGGTGSFDLDPAEQILTELQAGSYIFMDRQYNEVWADGPPFETSLFVLTTVVSASHGGFATTDAGLKSFATDAAAPLVAYGARADYAFFGDEYGRLNLPDNQRATPGQAVACVVPHCDPTVNLYGNYLVVKDGAVVERWPIASGKYRKA